MDSSVTVWDDWVFDLVFFDVAIAILVLFVAVRAVSVAFVFVVLACFIKIQVV
ncbi:hypothetical protein [Oceanobacillus kapialis]|uniref:hypothetical protein n=1 Tax=Oceanobacillus kapialis TaxID=481353 RepID=UPI00385157F7